MSGKLYTFGIGTPHIKGAGYYVNDKELNTRQEADIQTCAHCQAIIKMQLWKEDGGWCGKEQKPICGPCADKALIYGCTPFMKKIELAMKAAESPGSQAIFIPAHIRN